ncbi:MAG: outer membrane protein assembly factor BamA [Candidatus Omnitrophica bacterium]|nr:outer membrane protein assembly factor BamA [Candidatus Omnitrophota bacterium]
MKNKLSIFVMILALVFTACYPIIGGAETASGGKQIVDIRIKGNYSISTVTILNRLKIKPGDMFEESALNKELKRLYAMGYFSDVFIEVEDHTDGVIVVFTVVEKPIITGIEFRGNTHIKSPKLLETVSIKAGDLLDHNRLSQDVAAIKGIYVEEGYYRITVDYKVDVRDTGDAARVIYTINEGRTLKVKSVEIEGNMSFSDDSIKKLMATKPAWWFIQKGAFDEEKFQSDLTRIATFFRGKGYLDVAVTSRMKYSDDEKFSHITVVIDEGKRYMVGKITLHGDMVVAEEDVRELVLMEPGDPFDYELMREDAENVRMFYYDNGYMDADIDLQHRYNPTDGRMDLFYEIQAHDVIHVGKVNIVGNTKTKDQVVRREVRLYPGEKYDGKYLRRSKERIYNLGYFEDVYFETVPTRDQDVKDLNVIVKETKTGEFSFGGGYSSVDAFIGFVQIRQRNFDLLDFPTFTGAGQDLTIRAEAGSARQNYFVNWTDPWIFGFPYLFGFDVYREEHDRTSLTGYGYDERRTGGSLRVGKEIGEYFATGLVYNLEEVKISNLPDDPGPALERERGENTISRLTLNMNYDRRDNKYSPSKGYFIGFSVQNAGGFLGADKTFVKGWINGNYYHSIIKSVVLELRSSLGLAENYGDTDEIPIYERFFAGGATTVRGYEERGVGPRDRTSSGGIGEPIGGEALFLATAEVTFPIYTGVIKGAVFYDVGNVWNNAKDLISSEIFKENSLKQGAGIGVRVKTPIGPIKLDWGYPLSDNYGEKKEGRFYFSVSHGF